MEEISFKGILSYDEILPLEVACFGDGAATKVQFDERMQGPYWTVRSDGALVGFLNASVRTDHLHITHVEVAPDFRRRGIGGRLLAAARAFAGEAGIPRMLLRVRDDNAPARTLYQKFGFRETGHRQCRFTCPVEWLDAETDLRAKRAGDGYKYPVRLVWDTRDMGGGQFNEEVSGIKDLTLENPDLLLLPALAALKPLLKPGSEILYVMTDDDATIKACGAQKLVAQSVVLDMECPLG